MDDGRRPLVLVVDDDPAIRDLVRVILIDEGYRVTTATNGDAGLASLHVDPPDAVILDIHMPGLDGWGFRSAQLAMPEARDIPVVVYTASGRSQPPSPELAPAATLRKPFDVVQLLTILQGVLGPAAPVREQEPVSDVEEDRPPDAAPGLAPA